MIVPACLFLLSGLGYASQAVSASPQHQELSAFLEGIHDPYSEWTIDDLTASHLHRLVPAGPDLMQPGFKSGSFWYRVRLYNPEASSLTRYLVLTRPRLDQVDFYMYQGQALPGSKPLVAKFGGDRRGFAKRDIDHHPIIFEMTIPPGQVRDVFLRVASETLISVRPLLLDKAAVYKNRRQAFLFLGLFLGTCTIMGIYHFILFLMVRDRIFLLYLGLLFSQLALVLVLQGWACTYLVPGMVVEMDWSIAGILSVIACIWCFFSVDFLNLRQFNPGLARTCRHYGLFCLAWPAVALFLPNGFVLKYSFVLFLPCLPLSLFGARLSLRKGWLPAVFYQWGIIVMATTYFVRVLGLFSVIDMPLVSDNLFVFLILGQVTIVSLLVGERINDIRREQQEAVVGFQHNVRRFSLFMRHLPSLMTIRDEAGLVLYQNPFCKQLIGDREGQYLQEFYEPEVAEDVMRREEQVHRSGRVLRGLESFEVAGGARHYLVCRFPLPWYKTVPAVGTMALDITERIEARKALQKAHDELETRVRDQTSALQQVGETLRAVIESAPHSIFWKDRNLIYRGCNQFFAQWTGCRTADDVIGKTDYELPWLAEDQDQIRKTDQQMLDGGPPIEYVRNHYQWAGQQLDLLINKVALRDRHGQILGILGIIVDLTEQETLKRQEQERSQELAERHAELALKNEELLRSREQLVSRQKLAFLGALSKGLSHEIRNPLNFVNNFSRISIESFRELDQLLPDKIGIDPTLPGLFEEISRNLGLILKHGEQAALSVTRLDEHARQDETSGASTIDLNYLVSEFSCSKLVGPLSSGVALHENYASDVGFTGLPHRLGRVIINLIRNACEAIAARIGREGNDFQPGVWLTTRAEAKDVIFSVRDNGEGIEPKHLDQIFEPFFTTRGSGLGHLGMGLAIARDIVVDEHGGRLEVKQEGGFTEFAVILPKQEDAA